MLPATLHQEKNKGPSLYKHSELSPFTCYFPSKSGENSFHKKILGLCFVVFQIPQGRGRKRREPAGVRCRNYKHKELHAAALLPMFASQLLEYMIFLAPLSWDESPCLKNQ